MEGFVDNVKSEGFYFSTAQGCVGQVYFLNVLSARPWQVFTHIQGAFDSVCVCVCCFCQILMGDLIPSLSDIKRGSVAALQKYFYLPN